MFVRSKIVNTDVQYKCFYQITIQWYGDPRVSLYYTTARDGAYLTSEYHQSSVNLIDIVQNIGGIKQEDGEV
jgi:hypothetical protein